jgi:DNA-binding transcriptional regulator YiaG
MGPARTYIPNLRLQWHRHRLRLTQEQVAEQVALIAWERFAVRVGVDARMVSKWERGEKRPSRLYQECLRLLFNDSELFGAGDDAMNRRQWLRSTAAVGTAMLLAPTGDSSSDNGQSPDSLWRLGCQVGGRACWTGRGRRPRLAGGGEGRLVAP